ncbi:peptidylprolyl isomerase [Clostridiaceae bacterium Marseille-Q4145]|nr:peptidylprolyl isomerase [Clostridiaceae bacterium Marseille-Q4145]
MKKLTALFLSVAMCGTLLAGCGSSKSDEAQASDTNETTAEETTDASSEEDTELLTGLHHVTIDVKDYGTISLELDADTAPISVTNFINLAKDGFYDGLTFHRIISGFMIQGGDPKGNGTGGSDQTIKGEFSENGVENDISHVRGTISMARANDPDSASSQFFIVHEDSTFLDGQYAAFGHVTDGMDVVDAICENTPVQDNNGTVKADDQPVITSVTVID